MRRSLVVLPVAACLALLAPAAPVPKHLMKEPVYYFPTTVGAKWVYDEPDGDFVLVVSKVDDRNGTKVMRVDRLAAGGKRVPFQVMEVAAAGLVRTQSGTAKFARPDVALKLSSKPGARWDFDIPSAEGPDVVVVAFKGTRVFAGTEQVKVPAGTFEAVRVDSDTTSSHAEFVARRKTSAWYAPGVGLVKMTGENDQIIWLLKSFTPGRE